MQINTKQLFEIVNHPDGLNHETIKLAIACFLGENASIAHENYLTACQQLAKPQTKDFGLDHDQLRGIKASEKQARLVAHAEAKKVYKEQIEALNQQYHVLLGNIACLREAMQAYINGLQCLEYNFSETIHNLSHQYGTG